MTCWYVQPGVFVVLCFGTQNANQHLLLPHIVYVTCFASHTLDNKVTYVLTVKLFTKGDWMVISGKP